MLGETETGRFCGSSGLHQGKLLGNPHLGSWCGIPSRNDQTHSMSRPNEPFIAWLTGSGFSEEGWNGGLQNQTLRSFLPCHPDGGD